MIGIASPGKHNPDTSIDPGDLGIENIRFPGVPPYQEEHPSTQIYD